MAGRDTGFVLRVAVGKMRIRDDGGLDLSCAGGKMKYNESVGGYRVPFDRSIFFVLLGQIKHSFQVCPAAACLRNSVIPEVTVLCCIF